MLVDLKKIQDECHDTKVNSSSHFVTILDDSISEYKDLNLSTITNIETNFNKIRYVSEFIEIRKKNQSFLGEELYPHLYFCHLSTLQMHKPIGIHLQNENSHILVCFEEFTESTSHTDTQDSDTQDSDTQSKKSASSPPHKSLSVSFRSSFTQSLSKEEWSTFKDELFEILPMLKRVNGGSGSQSQHIPFFIQPQIRQESIDQIRDKMQALHQMYQSWDSAE